MSMRQIVDGLCARCYKSAESRCGKCQSRFYCSVSCQKKDWALGHKYACCTDPHPPVDKHPSAPSGLLNDPKVLASSFDARPSPTTKGLVNIGNTCYINAVLQCIAATPVVQRVLSPLSEKDEEGLLLDKLTALMREMSQGAHPDVAPTDVVQHLLAVSSGFVLGRQEDSHELYQKLLRSLAHEVTPQGVPLPLCEQETTAVHQLFGGTIASQLMCPKCHYTSTSYESCLDLQLEIKETITDTLEEMLEAFTCPEKLEADNKWKCEHCSAHVRALKQLSVYNAPNLLCIQLKRFRLGVFGKVNKHIDFPLQLNLKNFMTPGTRDTEGLEYDLYAILIHLDMYNLTSFGHYVALIKGSDGVWRLYDDNRVQEVDRSTIPTVNPYMLFYKRRRPDFPLGEPLLNIDKMATTSSSANGTASSSQGGMCLAGCGFFGSEAAKGYCSKCYRDKFGEQPPAPSSPSEPDTDATASCATTPSQAPTPATPESSSAPSVTSQPQQPSKPKKQAGPASVTAPKSSAASSRNKAGAKGQHVKKVGRNDPCPCGSGRKYKKCHGK